MFENISSKKLIFALIILCLIASFSLLLSHVFFSSPAFQADFSYAFKGKIVDIPKHKPDPLRGAIIEMIRTVLYAVLLGFIWHRAYPGLIVSDLNRNREGNKSNLLGNCGIGLLILSILTVLVWFHLDAAPKKLASNDSKNWYVLKEYKQFWPEDGKWGKDPQSNKKLALELKNEKSDQYFDMYKKPYIFYLPYSIINYIFLLIPFLLRAYKGSRSDLGQTKKDIAALQEDTKKASKIAHFEHSLALTEKTFVGLRGTLDRYGILIFFMGVVFFYEALLGYRTLSENGLLFSVLGFLSLMTGIIFVAPSIFDYNNALNSLRYRMAEIRASARSHQESTNYSELIKNSEAYNFKELIRNVAVSLIIKVATGLIGTIMIILKFIAAIK